ncbi:MAG: hypothetical protein IPO23_11520 [Flavobacterium sp.]|jgi:hypothetical protein|nr:hypothetical protein [Flavobacterium sp.]
MSANSHKNIEDQEIDLSEISKRVGGFFQKLNTLIFNCIRFLIKNKFIIATLFIAGIVIGSYFDKTNKVYDNQIIVTPNFESTDFLYSRIDLLQSKILENDTLFLKSIGIQEPKFLSKIEVKPIIDVYKFINKNNEQNFELLKLMAEDGDIKKIVEEKITSKNYESHIITFRTRTVTSLKKTIEPILKFINNNDYYRKMQKQEINNIQIKIKENEIIIAQINGFLNSFSNNVNGSAKSDKLIYYNENTQLNDVINTKSRLIAEQGDLRSNLVGYDKIVKDNNTTINIENTKLINGKLKIILPIFLIFIFVFIHFFISFYKRQSEKEYNK